MTTPTTYQARFLPALLLALAAAGCAKPLCSELGSCGGALPVGDWVLGPGHPSCSEQLYLPPPDPRLAQGDQPPARTPLPEQSLYDWCDELVFKGGDPSANHKPTFSFTDQTVGAAWVHYDGAGNYAAALTKTGTYVIQFPTLCVRQFGAMGDACTLMQQQLAGVSGRKNLTCLTDPGDPGGCQCRFDVSAQSGGSGTYKLSSSNTLLHMATARLPEKTQAADFPAYATYCNQGQTLELTGANGAYLFNEPALRTLSLGATTINCMDGVQGPGEDGVDCGAPCPMACVAAPVQ